MGFISDLLIEISSFRIRIGNKLNALKTLIDGKAEIDGSNIPYDTKWAHLKAGGLGDYYYTDAGLGSNFERVMVWDQGGWFWTNKSGFTSWLGLGDYIEKSKFGARNYAFVSNLLQKNVTVGSDSHGNYITGNANQLHQTLFTNAVFEENTTYTLFFRGYAGNTTVRFRLYFTDGTYQDLFFTTSATGTPILRTMLSPAHKTVDYLTVTYGSNTTFRLYDLLLVKGSTFTDWIPAPEDQVSDWDEADNTKFSYIKNKPDLSQFALASQITDNNYLDSIITTNGTTAGTVYTFKRVGLSDLTLQLTPASALFSGVVTIGDQTFEGIKTFLKSPKVPNAVNSDEAVNKSQLDAVGNAIPTNVVRTTTNQTVNDLKSFTKLKVTFSGTNTSTSAGWHRIATVSGRGYFEVGIIFTGGSFTPSSYIIRGFLSWTSSANQNDVKLSSFGGQTYVRGVRLVQDGDIYLEVWFGSAPTGQVQQTVSYLKGGNAVVTLIPMMPVSSTVSGTLWAEGLPDYLAGSTDFRIVRSTNFITTDYGSALQWNEAYNERVTQINITATTNIYTFSILLANSVQKQATLQTSATHFTINASGVLQLNAAIAQKINDAATETWVTQQIGNINIPTVNNGQLTVNTTTDLVGGFVFSANQSGNVTTTIGLSTAILNNIADGVTAYSWGNHANAGYTNLGAVQSWVNSQNFVTSASIGNGTIIVQGVGAITGVVTFQLNQSGNAIGSLDLTPSTKNDIQKGVTAEGWGNHAQAGYQNSTQVNNIVGNAIAWLMSGTVLHDVGVGNYNVPIESKQTIVRVHTYGIHITVDDGRHDGDELSVTVCGSGEYVLDGNIMDYCQNTPVNGSQSMMFWWVESYGMWVQV